jgi:hypothetical protein
MLSVATTGVLGCNRPLSCDDILGFAAKELAAFLTVVDRDFGSEQARLAAEEWLEELACCDCFTEGISPDFRRLTIVTASKLARRIQPPEDAPFIDESGEFDEQVDLHGCGRNLKVPEASRSNPCRFWCRFDLRNAPGGCEADRPAHRQATDSKWLLRIFRDRYALPVATICFGHSKWMRRIRRLF